ncbi:flowering time control protein [Salix suchowensis]|nr:flowering time control protein [Salix suchowensis]
MERHRGYRHRHHENRHSDFYQHHADRNQFNNHSHYNHEQVSGEVNEPFCSGGLRSNGRKRGRFHSPEYSDGGVDAKLYIAPIPRTTTEENLFSDAAPFYVPISHITSGLASNFGDSMEGCFVAQLLPMQQNRNLQLLISQSNHFFPVKHSPPQLSQVSLQHTKAPKKCFQIHQQAVFDTRKHTQNLEQQQRTPYPAGVPPSSQMVGSEECDWSGHSCPDGIISERFLILASQS